MNEDFLQRLFDHVNAHPGLAFSSDDINDFRKAMSDPSRRQKFHEYLTTYDTASNFGTWEEFDKKMLLAPEVTPTASVAKPEPTEAEQAVKSANTALEDALEEEPLAPTIEAVESGIPQDIPLPPESHRSEDLSTPPDPTYEDLMAMSDPANETIAGISTYVPDPAAMVAESTGRTSDTAMAMEAGQNRQKILAENWETILADEEERLADLAINDWSAVNLDDEVEVSVAKDEFRYHAAATGKQLEATIARLHETFDNTLMPGKQFPEAVEILSAKRNNLISKANSIVEELQEAAKTEPQSQADVDDYNKLVKEHEELIKQVQGVEAQLQPLYDNPAYQAYAELSERSKELSAVSTRLFSEENEYRERTAEIQQASDARHEIITKSAGGRDLHRANWTFTRGGQLAAWFLDSMNDFASFNAGVYDYTAKLGSALGMEGVSDFAKSKAREERAGIWNRKLMMDRLKALVPSKFQGQAVELKANYNDELDVAFDTDGNPLYFRDKDGYIQRFKEDEDIEALRELGKDAEMDTDIMRGVTSSEHSLYDMAFSILVTRNFASASAAKARLGIAGTSTVQMFGNEYVAALEAGEDPEAAWVDAAGKSLIVGFTEAYFNGFEADLARTGLLTPALRKGLSDRKQMLLQDLLTRKGKTLDLIAFKSSTRKYLSDVLGENVEEILQEYETKAWDSIVNGDSFDFMDFAETVNLVIPTTAVTALAGLVRVPVNYKTARQDVLSEVIWESFLPKNIVGTMDALRDLQATSAISSEQRGDIIAKGMGMVSKAKDMGLSQEDASKVSPMLLQAVLVDAHLERTDDPEKRERLLKSKQQIEEAITDVVQGKAPPPSAADDQAAAETEAIQEDPEITYLPESELKGKKVRMKVDVWESFNEETGEFDTQDELEMDAAEAQQQLQNQANILDQVRDCLKATK